MEKRVLAKMDSGSWGRGQRCRGLDERERPDCECTHLQRVGGVEETLERSSHPRTPLQVERRVITREVITTARVRVGLVGQIGLV